MSRVSRRVFLVGGGAGVVVAGVWGARHLGHEQTTAPALDGGDDGVNEAGIRKRTVAILLATAEAMAAMPIETSHYERLFNWRVRNLPELTGVYEDYARHTNDESVRRRGRSFVELGREDRTALLEQLYSPRVAPATGSGSGTDAAAPSASPALFRQKVLNPILVAFSRTDAFRAFGYESWEGTPRGYSPSIRQPLNDPGG